MPLYAHMTITDDRFNTAISSPSCNRKTWRQLIHRLMVARRHDNFLTFSKSSEVLFKRHFVTSGLCTRAMILHIVTQLCDILM